MQVYRNLYTFTLPSGRKVRLRRPSILSLIAAGGFPSELTNIAWKLQTGTLSAQQAMTDPTMVGEWAKLIEAFLPQALISPTVSDVTSVIVGEDGIMSGTVRLDEMPDVEKQLLFYCATWALPADEEAQEVVVSDLNKFREGAERGGVGRGSEEVRAEAQ